MKRICGLLFIIVVLLTSCIDTKDEDTNTDTHVTQDYEVDEKPVIYLYPEKETNIKVDLDFDGDLKCTYPEYQNGWEVKAYPDGKLINCMDNKEYSYLFWEGKSDYNWNITSGFVVKCDESAQFLQDKLSYIGLTAKEYNEFIVYWLPKLEEHPYNLIYFAGEDYTEQAKLNVDPKPDSIIRVFMVVKGLDKPIDIKEQQLKKLDRVGFTVVEWGGTKIQ